MFKDRSGMFEDFGFKLVVINSILEENTSFAEDLKKMKEKYVDNYDGDGYECIPEMIDYFENLQLNKEDLGLVRELVFDGGEDIYFLIMTCWDGESDLERVVWISMCDEALMEGFKENGIKVD